MNISFRGRRLRASSYLALLTFFAGVVLSAFGAHFLHQTIQQEARAEFDRMAVRTELEIAHRFEKVVYALRGAGGLYAASKSVERAEFREYVMARDMEKEFPGVRGFGFVSRVNREDLEQFVAAERADGAPEFAIRQLADKGQADLFVIKLLEPAANNQGALGLDLGSESLRRAGIQQAISTGADTVTGAITLVQDNKKTPGVLLYHPIYRPHLPLGTPLERRAALAGVLYAPIVMAEILKGIPDVLSGRLDFEIVDAPINSPEGPLMYDADGHVSKLPPGAGHGTGRRYSLRKPLDLPGRSVTLSMNSTSTFDAAIHTLPAWLLLLGGTLISALLSALLFQQASACRRAETLARGMTADLQSALRDNEALLSTLNLHAIVSIADREGDIIEVNDAFCKISGYGREELLGKNHRIVNSNLHDQEFWKEMWNVISSGFPWRGQVCNRAKDGSHYWVDTFVAPFIGRDGRIEKYVSIRIDITENKRNEQALQEAKEQAQAASLSKSQFLANMSHEIRTPMNAILGMLTLLRKTELTPRQADYAAKSDGAARALLGLLNEILDFSKIEAGKMVLDPQPFALDQLLRDLSVILSANVGDKPVEVIFDIDPAVPRELIGDAMRLQQVLINLGGNAIKFTAEGEVVLAVKVLGHTQDTVTLQWSVQDTGIGIAPENQARIFSGFTQAESSTTRRFGGTGLGVAISQRFVALMGGHLELQSELGKGSRFYFSITLPVVVQATAKPALQQDMQVVAGLEPGQRLQGLRLLLAEDNPNNQQVARELLQDEGADVKVVNHGREAVDALAAAPTGYDMVLMDLQMPVMDGLAATRAIRQELGLLKLPIIAMTANAMASDRQACLDAGMNDHVGKPFDLNKLVQVLRRWAGWSDASALPDPHRLDIRSDILTAAQAAQVDLQTAIQRLGGKQDIYRRMLATFVHDLRSMPAQLRQYAETGSTQETQRLLHTLKGLAATLGAQALSKEAAVAEKAVDIAHALHAIQDAQSPLEHLLAVMELDGAPGASAPTDAVIDKVALRHTLENLAQLLAESNLEAMNTMAEMELAYADALGAQLEPLRAAMSDMDFERALRLCQELMQI